MACPLEDGQVRVFVEASAEGFDVKVSGGRDRGDLAAMAQAGATWWGQWVDPAELAQLEDVIRSGPPDV